MRTSRPSSENSLPATPDYHRLVSELNADRQLHMIVRGDELEEAIARRGPGAVDIFCNKLLLNAPRAIVVTGTYATSRAVGEVSGCEDFVDDGLGPAVQKVRDLVTALGCKDILFIPERVTDTIENREDVGQWDAPIESMDFDFSQAYSNTLALPLQLGAPHLSRHIFETLGCQSQDMSITNIWLPELVNIPPKVLADVRRDEADSFLNFHSALRDLISTKTALTSEQLATELFQRVDIGVRQFESKMKQIARSRALGAYEAGVGLAAVGLCMALPSEIAHILSSALGAYQAKDFIKNLFRAREEERKLKMTEFYIPWLCTKLGKHT